MTGRKSDDRSTAGALPWLAVAGCFLLGVTVVVVLDSPSRHASAAGSERSAEVEAHIARTREHLAAGRIIDAHAEADRAETLAPTDPSVQLLLGDVAHASLRAEAAEKHYRRAMELDPH